MPPTRPLLRATLSLALALAACRGGDERGGGGPDAATDVGSPVDAAVTADADGESDPLDASAEPDDVVGIRDTGRVPGYVFEPRDLVGFVDPMIGTDGPGHAIPGALVPHGMVRVSPVSNDTSAIDAYDWDDAFVFGFAHTHLEGPGGSANGYAHVLVSPSSGDLGNGAPIYGSAIDHATEDTSPGYYAVTLANDVRAEVTATDHAGIHRYTWPGGVDRHVVVDLGPSRGRSVGGLVRPTGAGVEGFAAYDVHPAVRELGGGGNETAYTRVHFSIEASTLPARWRTWRGDGPLGTLDEEAEGSRLGVVVSFSPSTDPIELHVGISTIDVARARANRPRPAAVFDEVRETAEEAWNARLNRIQIDADDEDSTLFYTALYHSMMQPADHTEEGRYSIGAGGELETFEADGWRYYTDDWCMWDTFRTSHPLHILVEPEIVDDFIVSLLAWHDRGGWLPKCPWMATGYSRVMTGNPALPVIADAYLKGFRGFDAEAALDAMVHLADEDDNPFPEGLCGYLGLGTPPEYVRQGWVSHECDATQSASMTMEYAHGDWCIAEMAEAMGRDELATRFRSRGDNWRHHWDDETGFVRGRMRSGSWVEPFDPADMSDANDFVEASSWIFSFFVPHDVPGLIDAHGGPEAFVAKLDAFFDDGHFDASNQPSFHIPWLYAHAGRPDLTRARVRAVIDGEYGTGPGGLPGNDDAGSTSAWLVFAALGLYPVTPGDPVYTLAAPRFDRAEIFFDGAYYSGESFVIEAPGAAGFGDRPLAITLNGSPLDEPFLPHSELAAGGVLRFEPR